MSPMLISRNTLCGVVLVIEVPCAVVVSKHAIRVIHEVPGGRKVHLRTILPSIAANDGCAGWDMGSNVLSRIVSKTPVRKVQSTKKCRVNVGAYRQHLIFHSSRWR